MSSCNRFLFKNGVVTPSVHTPPVTTLLETYSGAYTTTRTHNDGSELLFWERHLRRLCNSARILLNNKPQFLFRTQNYSNALRKCEELDNVICSLVNDSMKKVLPLVLQERKSGEELAITTLVSGNDHVEFGMRDLNEERLSEIFDVYVYVSGYVPPVFGVRGNGANLAVVGRGRDVANAKYSDWVRLRKTLERLRPPLVTELLLSNDGDQILEGCLTNFFVVCLKDEANKEGSQTRKSFEVQTAPLSAGVLPGVIRQVIIDICLRNGILVREVAPTWSKRETWVAAFISNSLRVMQHVEKIQFPDSWGLLESKTWKDVSWEEMCFEFQDDPASIASVIQEEVMEKAILERYPVNRFTDY